MQAFNTFCITLTMVAGLIGVGWVAHDKYGEFDYSQHAFPCHEDEVLGYSPSFGPDDVGCIHIDALVSGVGNTD